MIFSKKEAAQPGASALTAYVNIRRKTVLVLKHMEHCFINTNLLLGSIRHIYNRKVRSLITKIQRAIISMISFKNDSRFPVKWSGTCSTVCWIWANFSIRLDIWLHTKNSHLSVNYHYLREQLHFSNGVSTSGYAIIIKKTRHAERSAV